MSLAVGPPGGSLDLRLGCATPLAPTTKEHTLDQNDTKKAEQTNSLPKLTLRTERVRVLSVRTGVQAGMMFVCSSTCFFVTQMPPLKG
jgi:hypothetical protein